MTRRRSREWRPAAAVPVAAAAAVYGWAHWSLGASGPATAVAVTGGILLLAAACAAYAVLAGGGSGGFFGALILAVALLLTVAAADQAASRTAAATCVVTTLHTTVQSPPGDAAPPAKTVYRLELRCPGGYPTELKDDRPHAAAGHRIQVAYDPARKVAPAVAGTTTPWRAGLWAAALLLLSTVIALNSRRPPHPPT
ncbi:hypothetical protein ACFWUQ_26650 [Streptomyces sp. NPDC058662]|uniref:hypothetical protein n=1 Tax=Streptomyces sp. NPDC058662 TaxID=3346583 RepID=UPI00365969C7